jgi:hypothetical protein
LVIAALAGGHGSGSVDCCGMMLVNRVRRHDPRKVIPLASADRVLAAPQAGLYRLTDRTHALGQELV